ncbi:patatin-like phospholipase family protein [Paeniglutamicibacter sp. R2-26]|uniref:patatin-like phospholipase family protein n=1 Tax=Paeniglutamicibacter sp. R2-26 TaxID=3144417 RepID=UPI003EE601A9
MEQTPFSTRYVVPRASAVRSAAGKQPESTDSDPVRSPDRRALVLGGGGSAGNAWLVGVLAGLREGGLDATTADLVVGTSAGATAAAQLTGANPGQLLSDILDAAPPQRPAGITGTGRTPGGQPSDPMRITGDIIAASSDPADMRRRLGAASLAMSDDTADSWTARWRGVVASRMPGAHWPRHRVFITAVDARTGEPVLFDNHSGVDLVDAVAASTSFGFGAPPYRIGEDRYIDGGYRRSSENADLAAGYGRVLVLSPLGGRSRTPAEWGTDLATQVEELRAGGSEVCCILPDAESLGVFGSNMMDLSTRPPAARAGYHQGRAVAAELAGFWS